MPTFCHPHGGAPRIVAGCVVGRWRWVDGFVAIVLGLGCAIASAAAEPDRPSVDVGWTRTAPEIDGKLEAGRQLTRQAAQKEQDAYGKVESAAARATKAISTEEALKARYKADLEMAKIGNLKFVK